MHLARIWEHAKQHKNHVNNMRKGHLAHLIPRELLVFLKQPPSFLPKRESGQGAAYRAPAPFSRIRENICVADATSWNTYAHCY